MTIQEAITEARMRDLWFRPISWRGSHQALTLRNKGLSIYKVPNARGGYPASMPDTDDICGEWEVVDPENVNEE